MDESVPVTVVDGDEETTLSVAEGRVLRDALQEAGFDVYGAVSRQANCGGRGLCGTCGVRLADPPAPEPEQWHDAAAERWGYPRLSCQIQVTEPLTVELVEKVVWGQLLPD
ncbi:ferredoxin [Halobacteriales archaeon QS_8_69_73]|nr:MAG: ferredoxin [Halobacteriales archaeon QS_8_69_73]